ncbi:MAG TPA: hypothetical protein VHM25_04945 [Polyangiaceae bacterium]|jgi:hypothetical protein|nr:hypothetical protein [Polyangiaceae bacterium]
MLVKRLSVSCLALISFACGRDSKSAPPRLADSTSAAPEIAKPAPSAKLPDAPPQRLTTLPVSPYQTAIAMDDDAVYLMTSNAAYRLVDGEPARGLRLDLGIGPVLTRTSFVFWSNGVIWSAPKEGGDARELAKFAHQPQYFVTSGEAFAWVDQSDDGLYTIQTLVGRKPHVLVSSVGELRSLDMIGEVVYFVQRPTDDTWRIGFAPRDGRDPQYSAPRKGRAPAQLTGSDGIYYYDLDTKRVLKLSLDLRQEHVQLTELVCSPIQVSTRIYCGCVEGLFDVGKDTQKPRILSYNRPGAITNITSNSKAVAWTVDVGSDQLAVDFLPASEPVPVP